jgi:oligoendopeptidase F
MVDLNLLDLDSRPAKAPGGYCYELAEIRLPFIFMNSVGRDNDVRTLLHEMGHAFHTFATRDKGYHFLYLGENLPSEFAEVASQTMELVGGAYLEGTFYNHEDAVRSEQLALENVVGLLSWVAIIDAFQHWTYTNPNHAQEEREEFWLKLHERFGGSESWDGYEAALRSVWQRQMHLYLSPFYYIDYAMAMLGALGLWTRFQKDQQGAIAAYKRALALGGSRPLPELFKAADLTFDFGPETVGPYARELRDKLIHDQN